jgi:hypothetical protein
MRRCSIGRCDFLNGRRLRGYRGRRGKLELDNVVLIVVVVPPNIINLARYGESDAEHLSNLVNESTK